MSGVAGALAAGNGGAVTLTAAGAVIMAVSVLLVVSLCVFCFWRILREPRPSEHHHVPLDIDTGDTDE